MFRTALATLISTTVLAMAPAQNATASEVPDTITNSDRCHILMTDNECRTFKATLDRITGDVERQRFLERHARLLRDRERACGGRVAGLEAARSPVY